ncbi:hypothetical protein RIF29_26070 [Crotalaria pallida]|uniref:Uncharacterized protein n=1 Tax=Crotalaria pallida TaxID=3830 RepID=A0AAN9I062_CROPI
MFILVTCMDFTMLQCLDEYFCYFPWLMHHVKDSCSPAFLLSHIKFLTLCKDGINDFRSWEEAEIVDFALTLTRSIRKWSH